MGQTKPTTPATVESKKGWVSKSVNTTVEYAETTLVLLYIFNGVASFLVLFGLVQSSSLFNKLVGALAFAFSIFALIAFINKGVKHQSSSKKGRR